MDKLSFERMDHHGIIAGVIRDLGIIEAIDQRLGFGQGEKISYGQAIAAMIINATGFSDQSLTFTPEFFENLPTQILLGKGVEPSLLNRHKLGRTLDSAFKYGTDRLFCEIAGNVCIQEGIDTNNQHLDTTSFSLYGEYNEELDTQGVKITHGHSKDNRPDLKQILLEMMVTKEGGIPFLSKTWSGNESDNEVFLARSKAIVEEFKSCPMPKYIAADSKLYTKKNAENLNKLPFITRVPESIHLVSDYVSKAKLQSDAWEELLNQRKCQEFELEHYGIAQRWIIVFSQGARNRAEIGVKKKLEVEKEKIDKEVFHLQAKRFNCKNDAINHLEGLTKKWKFYTSNQTEIVEHKIFSKRGRPNTAQSNEIKYQIIAGFKINKKNVQDYIEDGSCYVIGTNILKNKMTCQEVVSAYGDQQQVERGFRFLKDPLFFASSMFLKKTERIQGLIMVMTFALLVYSVAQRRLRNSLKEKKETLPNQIRQETQTPTLRWIFKLLIGVNRIECVINGESRNGWSGLTPLRLKILGFFGLKVMEIYDIVPKERALITDSKQQKLAALNTKLLE